MAATTTYLGRLVGINSRPYRFADRETGQIIEGTTHRLYVVTDDGAEPVVELKASDDVAEDAGKLITQQVRVAAEPRARDSQVQWHALAVERAGDGK